MQRGYVQHITSKHKRFVPLHIGRRRWKRPVVPLNACPQTEKLIDRNTKTAVSTLYNLFLFDINPIFFQRFCASNHSKYFSCSSTKCSHEYAVRISSKFAAINFSLSRTTYAPYHSTTQLLPPEYYNTPHDASIPPG